MNSQHKVWPNNTINPDVQKQSETGDFVRWLW